MIYLDWAATGMPNTDILESVKCATTTYYGNPSSPHSAGREAAEALDRSRSNLAAFLSCESDEVVFTSGGTESNNMALFSVLRSHLAKPGIRGTPNIVVSGIEHPSIYEPATVLQSFGFKTRVVAAEENGFVAPEKIEEQLDEDTKLVSLIHTHNETGAIQPIREVSSRVRRFARSIGRRIVFHTDAVQAAGKVPISFEALDADFLSLSGHKICAPRGIGALLTRVDSRSAFLYCGGSQEKHRRPGTQNVAGATGLALAVGESVGRLRENQEDACRRMQALIEGLQALNACIIPESRADRPHERFSPYVISAAFPPIPGEVIVRVLDDEGICVSTGSACSTQEAKRTRSLENMGIPRETAQSAIRISQGFSTTMEEIDRLISVLRRFIPSLRRIAG